MRPDNQTVLPFRGTVVLLFEAISCRKICKAFQFVCVHYECVCRFHKWWILARSLLARILPYSIHAQCFLWIVCMNRVWKGYPVNGGQARSHAEEWEHNPRKRLLHWWKNSSQVPLWWIQLLFRGFLFGTGQLWWNVGLGPLNLRSGESIYFQGVFAFHLVQ